MLTVQNLNREQMLELKQSYLSQLEETGDLQEVAGVDSLSYDLLADADAIVPDDVIYNHYGGVVFSEDDFDRSDEIEGYISGSSEELWLQNYHCRVSSPVFIRKEEFENKRAKKVLCTIAEIDGERNVSAMVRKSRINYPIRRRK